MHRRRFLATVGAGVALGGLDAIAAARRAPALLRFALREADAPSMPGGVQSGDVTGSRAMMWSRTDRAARMMVEVAAREDFAGARTMAGPNALEDSGFTARLDVGGLAPGEPVFYRVWFEDLAAPGLKSAPVTGRFRTAPAAPRDLTILWSGDTVGQGWGINEAFGGLRIYEAMAAEAPDLFIHSGDMIYADNPLRPEVLLDDGTLWRNVVTPAKSKVAETLDEFRGNYAYNLMDAHARRFNSQVPVLAQWDDHEVLNNWYPGRPLEGDARYAEKSVALLAARARRAMFDYLPIRPQPDEWERVYRAYRYGPALEVFVLDQRSYRSANGPNRQLSPGDDTRMMGPAQLAWLKASLRASEARWKILASDMPLGVVIGDGGQDGRTFYEGWANGDGPPLGRELELRDLLSFIKAEGITGVVWITADIHYAAAHRYEPSRAVFTDFDPFWEFVAGPMHAGTFGPGTLDPTFGPEAVFVAIPPGMKPNRPPSAGFQFYGRLKVEGATGALTVSLHDLTGRRLWEVRVED